MLTSTVSPASTQGDNTAAPGRPETGLAKWKHKGDGGRLSRWPTPSQTPAPSHSLQVTKQGARASSPLTQHQNQHHSYRTSPEPLKVTHARSFLSQPTPWPVCPSTQPGMEQKPRSAVLNPMVLSVSLSCQGFLDSSRGSGQIYLRGQQFPGVLQQVRDIEERGRDSPTTDSAFQTGSGHLTNIKLLCPVPDHLA